jgi:hypothetical protein
VTHPSQSGPVPTGPPAPVAPAGTVPSTVVPAGGSSAAVFRRANEIVRTALAGFEGSPGRLRVAGALGVAGGLIFAVLGFLALQARADALADARAHAEQLVRIQQISADLVAADSQFTNGYLTYGTESAEGLSSYESSVHDASRGIAEAAEADPADTARLAEVNDALTQYTARVAAARANNKQGFQVATGYLRQASTLLRSSDSEPNLLPALTDLATVNAERVDAAFAASRRATWLLAGAALVGLGLLVTAQLLVARRSHRVFNIPMAAGTVGAVVALLVAGSAMAVAQSKASHVKDSSYAATVALANARIDAYLARSYASITLIYIGTGGDYTTSQEAYQAEVARARTGLEIAAGTGGAAGADELTAWETTTGENYDTALQTWTEAADAATADSTNALFTAFEEATDPVLERESAAVSDGLGTGRGWLLLGGWLVGVFGVVAAATSWIGVSQRLEEYR